MAAQPMPPDPETSVRDRKPLHTNPRPSEKPRDPAPHRPFRFTDFASL